MIETLESRVPPYDRSRSSYLLSDRDPYPYASLRMVPGPDAETVTGPAAVVASSLVDTAPTTAADSYPDLSDRDPYLGTE